VLSQNLEIFSYLAETNDVDSEGRYMALAYHVNNAELIKYIERRNIGKKLNLILFFFGSDTLIIQGKTAIRCLIIFLKNLQVYSQALLSEKY
jgi:hypothetical protein